jgi:hypothetical protein
VSSEYKIPGVPEIKIERVSGMFSFPTTRTPLPRGRVLVDVNVTDNTFGDTALEAAVPGSGDVLKDWKLRVKVPDTIDTVVATGGLKVSERRSAVPYVMDFTEYPSGRLSTVTRYSGAVVERPLFVNGERIVAPPTVATKRSAVKPPGPKTGSFPPFST